MDSILTSFVGSVGPGQIVDRHCLAAIPVGFAKVGYLFVSCKRSEKQTGIHTHIRFRIGNIYFCQFPAFIQAKYFSNFKCHWSAGECFQKPKNRGVG